MNRRKRREQRKKKRLKTAIKRTLWILGIPTSPKHYRGLIAERKILVALRYHQKKKTEFPGGRVIKKVTKTVHFGPKDIKGIDALVEFQDGETLPIQIQNWWTYETEVEFWERGICLIAIWPNEDKVRSRERAFEAISSFYQSSLN